jgi:hypothetical protein
LYFKEEGKEHKKEAPDNSSLLGFLPREREREREMVKVKVVERKKKEKRGQPPLSDLGDPPLEEKQQRKLTRRDSVPAPLRRSRCLKPNPDADKIRHGKPEKRVRIHPKKEEKQVSSFDLNYNACPDITAEEIAFFEERVLKKSDVSKINLLRLLRTQYIYIYICTPFTRSLFVVLGLFCSLHVWGYGI